MTSAYPFSRPASNGTFGSGFAPKGYATFLPFAQLLKLTPINENTNEILYLDSFGSPGVGPDKFDDPKSVSCAAGHLGFGEMSVTENWNQQSGLQSYSIATDVKDLVANTFAYQGHCAAQIRFTLVDLSQLKVQIFNSSGVLMRTLYDGLGAAGYWLGFWNGTYGSGLIAPGGDYRVRVTATSKYIDSEGLPVNQVIKDIIFTLCNPLCSWRVGDTDGNGAYSIADAVYVINYIFAGGPPPTPHAVGSGDADCSGNVSIADPVYLINYIFTGGPAPQCSCDLYLKR